ncbi:MBL fold metallo-hydrolase [Streptomyces sp. SB3404]|uniref:MBL fold metallo-hydrolase n=2 Tax=Streptomyces boncukensis TaxID=2711219 RepID=A0A6G4WZV9_9ACTN|nr:MBL fold metallo-hydrolase [Streptomyces boncukensis]
MRLTVLGGCGAWPTATQPCSGYLVDYESFRLLIDPGYATFPRLLALGTAAEEVDAVLVSHGHPDHCADLNPLLRARQLGASPPPPLPVHAPRGALETVLALDKRSMLGSAYALHEFWPGGGDFDVGPFRVTTRLLPHFVPNAGLRLTAPDGRVLTYTGDTGPSPEIPDLARESDLLLSEATYVHRVPDPTDAPYLLTAQLAGQYAAQAGARELLLTHLWPGTEPGSARTAAGEGYCGGIGVATPGLTVPVLR